MFPSVTFRSSGQIYTLADAHLLHDQITEGLVGGAEASSALTLWVAQRGSVPLREFLHDANGRSSQGLQSLTDEEVLKTVRAEVTRRIGARFVVLRGMSYLNLRRPSAASGGGGNSTIDPPTPTPGGGDPAPVTTATLTVEVVNGEGQPLTTAEVTLNGSRNTLSDGGSVVYEDLSAGRFRAKAELEGYSEAESEVDLASGESKSVRLTLRKLKAVLVWPANGADHKQYVNLDAVDSNPEFGKQIPVKIKVANAKAGDKLYIKMEYDDAKVSKRSTPSRAVVGGVKDNAWCPQGGKEITLTMEDEEVIVKVELGYAGGDKYKVSVGTTQECTDESFNVTNWRKLWYEVMVPDIMALPATDLPAACLARISSLLDPNFLEYKVHMMHTFAEAAAPAGTVFDAAYFPGATRKQFVLTDHTFTLYPSSNGTWDDGKRPRSVGLRLCDRNFFNDSGTTRVSDDAVTTAFVVDVRTRLRRWMLPKSGRSGRDAIRRIRWRANIDAAANPGHPAVSGGARRSGQLDPVADVTFNSIRQFTVNLPTDTPTSPGSLVGPTVTPTHCPITLSITFEAADEGLGLAGQGAQSGENLVCYAPAAPQTTMDVLVHEFCHSAGMAVIGGTTPPPGLATPKTTAQADPDNQDAGSTLGHLYVGHGHSGGHCARGLTDAQKRQANYGNMAATCINFGENSLQDPSARTDKICVTCGDVLRARQLTSI